jgi:S-adenosylmethionine-diacylgycerolhomoserine-N-methlytransferase
MMKDKISTNREGQVESMKSYYAFQAKIYDATRWTFLYGRNTVLEHIPFPADAPIKILEVGCGTGVNLRKLGQIFPNAELYGLDVSGDMLNQAEKNLSDYEERLTLLEEPYEKGTQYNGQFDVILFSYALTMINPQWQELLEQAPNDLTEHGVVVVVDFHKANVKAYKKFMSSNHVRLDGQLVPYLVEHFDTKFCRIKTGLAGVWDYMMYVGKKK